MTHGPLYRNNVVLEPGRSRTRTSRAEHAHSTHTGACRTNFSASAPQQPTPTSRRQSFLDAKQCGQLLFFMFVAAAVAVALPLLVLPQLTAVHQPDVIPGLTDRSQLPRRLFSSFSRQCANTAFPQGKRKLRAWLDFGQVNSSGFNARNMPRRFSGAGCSFQPHSVQPNVNAYVFTQQPYDYDESLMRIANIEQPPNSSLSDAAVSPEAMPVPGEGCVYEFASCSVQSYAVDDMLYTIAGIQHSHDQSGRSTISLPDSMQSPAGAQPGIKPDALSPDHPRFSYQFSGGSGAAAYDQRLNPGMFLF